MSTPTVRGSGSSNLQRTPQQNQDNQVTVRKGDTLSGIAHAAGVPLQQLIDANPQIKNPDLIFPGQQINVPAAAQQSAPAPAGQNQGGQPRSDGFQPGAAPTQTARPQTSTPSLPQQPADPALQSQLQNQRLQANTARPGATGQPQPQPQAAADSDTKHAINEGALEVNGANLNGSLGDSLPEVMSGRRGSTSYQRSQEWNLSRGSNSTTNTTTTRNGNGTVTNQNRVANDGNGRNTSSQSTSFDRTASDGSQRNTTVRNGQGTDAQGNRVSSTTVSSSRTADGETVTETTRRTNTQRANGDERNRTERDAQTAPATRNGPEVEATATLAAVERTFVDPKTANLYRAGNADIGNTTGAGAEVRVGSVEVKGGAAATVDLKTGNVNVGAQIAAQVDVVAVTGRAQLGDSTSRTGQAYVKGDAGVRARGEVGGGATVNLATGTAKVGVGAEGFAGAEAKGSVGYQSRYFGAEVEGTAQAGIGGAARAEIGFDRGNFKANVDLGACVGLGGRVKVNVNVNVGAIAKDGYNWVKSWF